MKRNFNKKEKKNNGNNDRRSGTSVRRRILMVVLSVIGIAVVVGLLVLGAFAVYIKTQVLPQAADISLDIGLNFTSIVYYTDENGETQELERLHGEENRIWADFSDIPQDLRDAIIAIEDERFMQHNGVDWKRTTGAVLGFFSGSSTYGGSTITQQLIKNITGEDDYKVQRKIIEIFRALELEKKYSKDQILELYLNTIHLGSGLNGVQTAANKYFGKELSELTLAESASIAGITQYPVKFNPLNNPENNKERQETILWKMKELGMITQEEYEQAKAEELVFTNSVEEQPKTSAQSYYVDQVMADVLAALMEEKGYTQQYALRLLYSGGLQIFSEIDVNVQRAMDEVFMDPESFPTVKGEIQPESAMIIMDPYTGAIKGVVGGRGEKTASRTFNRATGALRQPGSAIKPISVYAPALEYGWITSGSVMDDIPVDAGGTIIKNYYSNFKGLTTIKKAVEISVNTVPVQIIKDTPGAAEAAFNFVTNNLGVTSLVKNKTINGKVYSDVAISPLALGGLTQGISVKEITAAYTPFVNKGIYNEPYTFTKVLDHNGNVLLERETVTVVAMKEETAYIMNKLLQNVAQNGTGTPARFSASIPMGGKTGTTNEDKDRWFVGYTPYYVGTVWVGFDQPNRLPSLSVNPAVKAWRLVMAKVHENVSGKAFADCSKVVQVTVCSDSGKLPSENCLLDPRGSRLETCWYVKGTEPTETCDLHVTVDIDTTTGQIATVYCPQELRKKVALLNYKREFPMGENRSVIIDDAQYTFIPYEGIVSPYLDPILPVYMNMLSPGTYPGVSPTPKSGARFMNTLSSSFLTPAVAEPPEDPDDDDTEPNGHYDESQEEPPGWWTFEDQQREP